MKNTILLLLALAVFSVATFAQYNSALNYTWAFGYKAGLDFHSGAPVPIETGLSPSGLTEGCASVCDSFGHMLFYSNGIEVFNRNNVIMPSGASITSFSTQSTTQAALIAPVIGAPGKYYLFSLEQTSLTSGTAASHLVYCIVDMTLDSGLGDVVSSTIGTAITDSLTEKMIAVTGNDQNIWILVHKNNTPAFLAYEITGTGISSVPVVSAVGTFDSPLGYSVGAIKVSPNRRRIVSNTVLQPVLTSPPQKYGTELYDFDPGTGIVSNCVVLDSLNSHYGAEFSPNSNRLYTDQRVASDTMSIVQYDLEHTLPDSIRMSKTEVALVPRINGGAIKLGPDKKIYFISIDTFSTTPGYSRYLDCITAPDMPASACGYVYRAISLSPGTGMQLGFPNLYVSQDTTAFPPVSSSTIVAGSNEINVFPNPATQQLTISTSSSTGMVRLINGNGQVVYKSSVNHGISHLDVSRFPRGLYYVFVEDFAPRMIEIR